MGTAVEKGFGVGTIGGRPVGTTGEKGFGTSGVCCTPTLQIWFGRLV